MLKDSLIQIFERDLDKLKSEIKQYADEGKIWLVKEEISNSAGNLCLHLVGNLNHFIGAILGGTNYVRDRDSEFSTKEATRENLIARIAETKAAVTISLNKLKDEDFNQNFPVEKHGETVKTDFMLLHLLTHFNYHLGQINYHRRLIS